MYGIVYTDFLAHLISRMNSLLQGRSESYALNVEVSNRKSSKSRRAVLLSRAPGGGSADTMRTAFVQVDVIADDEGDCTDLMNLTLALLTSRGVNGVVDGQPVTYASVNGGPNDEPSVDGFFAQTAQLEIQHRGVNL